MHTAIDILRELRALHEDGLLSRQEFDSRKNAILDAACAPLEGMAAVPVPAAPLAPTGPVAGGEIGPENRRYRLERLIAQGGMGQVWQATDLATQAELGHSAMVALKILPPGLTRNPSHARLLIEQTTQARGLAHDHIVRVYEWAQDPATSSYFIIMECLDGEGLESLLAREAPMPLERALGLMAPVAGALDYAWTRHQLVHRDIKPGNVFVTRKGNVKLLDFGIATRVRRRAGDSVADAPATPGTSGYRAPEASVRQRAPGPALDVYSVAVMIYQMVAGKMPFGGRRSASRAPARPDALDEREWQVLQSGFARDPLERPASVTALLDALRGAPQAQAEQEALPASEEQLALQRKAAADAAARALIDQQRKQIQAAARAEAEAARRVRREELRRQLRERRAQALEEARIAQEEQQRKAMQARAAQAYRAEQQRASAEPQPAPPPEPLSGAAAPEVPATGVAAAASSAGGVLRDRFLEGSGSGPELVVIRAGRFEMGSPAHERKIAMEAGAQQAWLERETPQHWVAISQPFALGRYPVTVGEWREFVRATGWQPKGEVDWNAPGFEQNDEHPVVGVSWDDSQQYLRWLGGQTGEAYRLPSEAEWEYACRAGTHTAFSFGDRIDTGLANYNGEYSYNGSPPGEYRRGTTWVGQFAPNPWGLFDMHGNVWEWVQDVVHDDYHGAPADGTAWEQGGDPSRRMLRGGSWLYNPYYLRSALRNGFSAALGNDIVGFRVARPLRTAALA